MSQAKIASFDFEKFIIPNFSYNDSNNRESSLNLNFTPKGRYYQKSAQFELELDFWANENDEANKNVIYVKLIATFKFNIAGTLLDIPPFFYKNAIAIVYPFIRTFISTLTLQANTGLILLGLMNLSSLEKELIDNTTEIISE